MSTDPEAQIRRIHNAGRQFVLAFTGGGSGTISALLRVPGGSKSVLEAIVPYSQAALIDLIGGKPEQFCSDRTARIMAMAAWRKARKLAPDGDPNALAGLGCTASLASDRPKKGAHRAFLAIQTARRTATASIELIREKRTRAEEEDLVAALALNLAAEAAGLAEWPELSLLPGEKVERNAVEASSDWHELFLGRTNAVRQGPADEVSADRVVFPGAFNPLHHGHREMAGLASRRSKTPVQFEISIENVDKPPLDFVEIECRAGQFVNETLWLTRAATFVKKSRLFPGATFVVGADTIVRIGQARYYGDNPAARDAAIREIAANGCRFLVFPRAENVVAQPLEELDLPTSLRELCDGVTPVEFRADISSTQLRASSNAEV